MPTYEMPLLLRVMTRPEIVTTLKRISSVIFSKGGFIRKIDNLGLQRIPYRTSAHGHVHHEANYFIFQFDVPPRSLEDIKDEYLRDIDIVRNRVYKTEEEQSPPCTLQEELLPPAYRPDVKRMISVGRRRESKYKFKYNSGLNYYPFQK